MLIFEMLAVVVFLSNPRSFGVVKVWIPNPRTFNEKNQYSVD